ncbi:response regulator transcription factor [Desulfosporosinus sp. FKB]|uniref:response regulator transcription factor n=1 Tax=Desulfosporosinus sp. FKB TaxID=1969835 RepID=UPI000B49A138|nr:response regulator transcription factor [Desulfosporosinus sp. FKB]
MLETTLSILLVEDDRAIAKVIALELEHHGHRVGLAADGRMGLDMALTQEWDVILLDLMLPFLNGYEICKEIRARKDTPILLLTAKDEVQDKVFGLDLGADDYLTKPFAMDELMARIRAVLRRKNPPLKKNSGQLTFRELELDTQAYQVYFRGEEISLTKKEFELLTMFLEHPNRVLSREHILENVWGFDFYGESNAVDVYVRFLRGKIDERFGVHYFHTVRGVGYVLRAED